MTLNCGQAMYFQGDVLFVSSNVKQFLVKSTESVFVMIKN